MKYTIIPEIIGSKRILFLNEKNVKVNLCNPSPFKYLSPFEAPFIVIDTFAKKTSAPQEIITIEAGELGKLGMVITRIRAGRNNWFRGQRVIYRIESSSNISPGSKTISSVPAGHSIQKDVTNKMVRLVGPNAGWPRKGNGGPWIEIKEK